MLSDQVLDKEPIEHCAAEEAKYKRSGLNKIEDLNTWEI
jgi:hypothetical protein